jgi:hypothetical protein
MISEMRMKKGQTLPGVWIIIILGLFVVTSVFIIFNQVITGNLYQLAVANNVDSDVLGTLMTSWKVWPILFIFALFMWGLANSGRDSFIQYRTR